MKKIAEIRHVYSLGGKPREAVKTRTENQKDQGNEKVKYRKGGGKEETETNDSIDDYTTEMGGGKRIYLGQDGADRRRNSAKAGAQTSGRGGRMDQ